MKAYIVLFTAAFLVAATAISVNTMTAYARSPENMIGGGPNMTADANKIAPSGSTKGVVAQGRKFSQLFVQEIFKVLSNAKSLHPSLVSSSQCT